MITALEANVDISNMDVVMQHLLHGETKLRDCNDSGPIHKNTMMSHFKKKLVFNCENRTFQAFSHHLKYR